MKIKWLKAGIFGKDKGWLSLLMQDIDVNKISSVGSEYCESILYKLNAFWKVVFTYYKDYVQHLKFKTGQDILSSCIWYNRQIGTEKIYFVDWFKHGVRITGDIVNSEWKVMSLEQIKTKYKFSVNILNLVYYSVKKLVEKFITKIECNFPLSIDRPHIPFHIKALTGHILGSKSIYLRLQESNTPKNKIKVKWNLILHMEPSHNLWRVIYKNCFYTIDDNNYIWFQYRILQRIIGVQDLLFKTKISDNADCRLCNQNTETITHLFSECPISNNLWENVISWTEARTQEKVNITKNMKILGCLESLSYFWPLNFILLITRYYIFTRTRLSQDLNIYHLQKIIKTKYSEQESLSKMKNSGQEFMKKWSTWSIVISPDESRGYIVFRSVAPPPPPP